MINTILSILFNGLLAFAFYKVNQKKDKPYYLLLCIFFSLGLAKTILFNRVLTPTTNVIYIIFQVLVFITACVVFYKQELYKKK